MADRLSSDKLERQLIGVDREIETLERLLKYKKPGGVNFNQSERRQINKDKKKLDRLIKLRKRLVEELKAAEKRNATSAQNFPRMGGR